MTLTVYTMPDRHFAEAQRSVEVIQSKALVRVDTSYLATILDRAREATQAKMAAVTIIHEDCAYLIAASGFPAGVYRRSTSFCGHAILEPDQPFVVLDATRDDRFAGNPYVDVESGIRFYAASVLLSETSLPLGTLCVFDFTPRDQVSAVEMQYLTEAAAEIAARLTSSSSEQ